MDKKSIALARVTATSILCILVLSACGTGVWRESSVRELPEEITANISIGDTQEKVRSKLGDPLIYSPDLGLEVYRQSGRDIDFAWIIYPFPAPGEKTTVAALILYDEAGRVSDVSVDAVEPYFGFYISAGDYIFVGRGSSEPETLLGPPTSLSRLEEERRSLGGCTLVLVMGECPMEKVFLDSHEIADLSPIGGLCGQMPSANDYYRSFIAKEISTGSHMLLIRQETGYSDREFEAEFSCKNGEPVYVMLDAVPVRAGLWEWPRFEGKILISKEPTKTIEHLGDLSPILWHRGVWYRPN
jgi:hypothetical protein